MSYHIVHVLRHGARLGADRGCLTCSAPDMPERRAPIDDILAVVIAARGVSFSSDCISRLLQAKSVILHCDEKYRPAGKTMPLSAVVHGESFTRQISCEPQFCNDVWQRIVRAKVRNQAVLLDTIKAEHDLWKMLDLPEPDEGNAARHYWKRYFRMYGRNRPKIRERRDAEHPVNQLLNYSYAVLSAILHRSLVIHGLNPSLGVHHRYRFKSDPLVYDFFEPLRPVCDFLLLRYHLLNPRRDITDWSKQVAKELVEFRLKVEGGEKSLKIVNAIDRYAASAARAFETGQAGLVCPPLLPELKFEQKQG